MLTSYVSSPSLQTSRECISVQGFQRMEHPESLAYRECHLTLNECGLRILYRCGRTVHILSMLTPW